MDSPRHPRPERPVRTGEQLDLTEEQEGQLAAGEESLREEAARAHSDEQPEPVTREEGMDRRD